MRPLTIIATLLLLVPVWAREDGLPRVERVELQPLGAQVSRLVETLDYLGAPLPEADRAALTRARDDSDASRAVATYQEVLDRHVLVDRPDVVALLSELLPDTRENGTVAAAARAAGAR